MLIGITSTMTCIIQIYALYALITKWIELKDKNLLIYRLVFVTFVVMNFVLGHLYSDAGIFIHLLFLSAIFTFFMQFKIRVTYALLGVLVNSVVTSLSELFAGISMSMVAGKAVNQLRNSEFFYCMGCILSTYVYFFIVNIISMILKRRKTKLSKMFVMCICIIPVGFEVVTLFLFRLTSGINNKRLMVFSLITTMMLVIATLIIMEVIDRQIALELESQKMNFMKMQLESQKTHYKQLYQTQKDTRRIWHDMKNSLTAINGLIEEHQANKAEDYLIELTGKMENLIEVVNTGYPAVDAIIKSKMDYAKENGCAIDYKILLPPKLYINEIEFSLLIGNLLDNAIEAVIQLEDNSKKTIQFRIVTRYNYISVEVKNYMKPQQEDTKHFTTTKQDKLHHGFGLENVKTIVEKYDGDLNVECKNEIFLTQALVSNRTSVA